MHSYPVYPYRVKITHMPSFLEIFFEACSVHTAWTYRSSSRDRDRTSRTYTTRPSHQISTPQEYPISVNSCQSLASFISNPRTTAYFVVEGGGIGISTAPYYRTDQEWTAVDTFLLAFDTQHTPSGRFPVHSDKTGYGYDAAVCVRKYEPWVIETYNTSIASPSALRIIEKGTCTSPSPSGNSCLNTTGKDVVFQLTETLGYRMLLGIEDDRAFIFVGGDPNAGPSPIVGPTMPPYNSSLISTYSAGCFFYQWHWAVGIHRTLRRPSRRHPRTDGCGLHTTIFCGIRACRRTIIHGPNPSIRHL